MKLDEARSEYVKLLRDTEELTPELLAMAKESFTEGWVQCEQNNVIGHLNKVIIEQAAKIEQLQKDNR